MGYYTRIEGSINYGDTDKVKQEIIEKIFEMIDLVQWNCSASYTGDIKIEYYTKTTEWMHYTRTGIDKSQKIIDLSGERKNYDDATQTLLHFITPYLNKNNTYTITLQGEDEDDNSEVTVTNGQVFVDDKEFITFNELAFPLPHISARRF